MAGAFLVRLQPTAREGDEGIVERDLLDPELLGDDLMADQLGDHRRHDVPGAADDDLGSVAMNALHIRQTAEEGVLDRHGRLEANDLLGAGSGNKPGRSVDRDDLAAVDQCEPIGQAFGFLHEMRNKDDGDAALLQVLDQIPRIPASLRVESGGQLVENRDFGVSDQRQGNRETLLLAPGEILEPLVPFVGDAELVEKSRANVPATDRTSCRGRVPPKP